VVRKRNRVARIGTPGLPVAVVRATVEREVAHASLRGVAANIGLSPNALRNFIRGATPRAATRAKLERWIAGLPREASGPRVSAFSRLIVEATPGLPPREATTVGRELTRAILSAYERRQLPPPRWVRELSRHYSATPE
jgi:hypothetical protein